MASISPSRRPPAIRESASQVPSRQRMTSEGISKWLVQATSTAGQNVIVIRVLLLTTRVGT
jgi:hypothetical protein